MRRLFAVRTIGLCRVFSEFNDGSVLGTSTLSTQFLVALKEDLKHEEQIRTGGIGETLTNYVNRAELSHMESPEADIAFQKKLDKQVDDFFSNISLPEDPMKAALARSEDELKEEVAMEVYREAVREAYLRRLDAKKAEELRLKRVTNRRMTDQEKRLDPTDDRAGTAAPSPLSHPPATVGRSTATPLTTGNVAATLPPSTEDEAELREQLAEMRRRVHELEALLKKGT